MICKTVKSGNKVFIDVDGEVLLPVAYMTYKPIRENYSVFQEAGAKLSSFGVYAPQRGINSLSAIKPFTKGYYLSAGNYDFTRLFADLETATRGEKGLYTIPRVYLDCPVWWEDENPGELCRTSSGAAIRQSFASEKWRRDMADTLRALIDAVEASKYADNVIGYQVAAGLTEEWMYHGYRCPGEYCDYSERSKSAFNKWLEDKYSASPYAGPFNEDIPPPMLRAYPAGRGVRDITSERLVTDYYEYHNFIVADAAEYFCRTIKDKTKGSKLTGAFYGYICDRADPEKGHACLDKLLDSPFVDFFASPISYFDCRGDGVDWPFMAPVHSAALHGKLWFIEADIRTNLTQPLAQALPDVRPDNGYYGFNGVWKGPDSEEQSLNNIKKCFANVLCSHVGTWWFDMWGGWYNSASYMDFYKKAVEMYAESLTLGAVSAAQVAVIVDDASCIYTSDKSGLSEAFYESRKALGLTGTPYEMYMLSDIQRDDFPAQRIKAFIFLDCVKTSAATRESIDNKLKKDGKVLIWTYFNGVYDESGRKYDGEELTGFKTDSVELYNPVSYKGGKFPNCPVNAPVLADLGDARVIVRDDQGRAAVAFKDMGGWTSVYSVLPNIHENLLRELLNLSGIHIYSQQGDVVYADSLFLSIYTVSEGWHRLYLPSRRIVCDAQSGEVMNDGQNDFFDFYSPEYTTRIFKYL